MEDTQHITVVNLHTIIGGCIGAVSLFLPWIIRNGSERYSLFDLITGAGHLGLSLDRILPLGAIIVLMATIFNFISPIASATQIGGIAMIYFTTGIATIVNSETSSVAVGFGLYIGLLSPLMAFLGIAFPFGFGYGNWRVLGNRGRFYTFSFYRDVDDSDGQPYMWWWAGLMPGMIWYWVIEMDAGWAYRGAWQKYQEKRAIRIVRKMAEKEHESPDYEEP
ncbi:MAG: hypothetical protein IH630_03045 [Thermoplasmata archaeon]|nr:hypothetical protein [Thermoplasmata archaeon]TFG68657.1 MAG: hypothetical protein E4H25_05635 [Methanomassiliicoccus sp.]